MTKSIHGRNIHLAGLRYFYEVATVGSFRGAADRLHVAASAINRQVQIVEEELGCRLFDRGRGRAGITLTAAGRILLDDVRTAMDSIEHACSEITALHGLRRGNVEIGINEGFASAFFPRFLRQFSAMHSAITFDVRVESSPTLIDMLMNNELELVLAYNPPPRFGIEILAQFEVDTMVMMHKSHPLATKTVLTGKDLAGHNLLLPSTDLGSRHYLDEFLVSHDIQTATILTTNSYTLRQRVVMENLGLMVMCFHPVHRVECGPDVVFRTISDKSMPPQHLICCKKLGRELTPASMLMASTLTAELNAGEVPKRRRKNAKS